MKVELTKQEYIWLADLVKKDKETYAAENEKTPHPLLELRRDNMASLEAKINAGVQRQIQRDGRNVR
ncbi:MAG: hypothetical protein LBI19_01640 [Oscillospiraceae bacterium]|jgi:hypothetical protein|nr:hypothetical protein [Oscillospiraceae bacterium]